MRVEKRKPAHSLKMTVGVFWYGTENRGTASR